MTNENTIKKKLTLGEFRKATKDLSDNIPIYYHAYYKGCCLNSYLLEDVWMFPHDGSEIKAVVINPGDDYDPRKANKVE